MQKAIQNALAQQKTEYQSLLEKQKSVFQSQMAQQVSTPQTVEPVRQPKGSPSSLKTEEGLKNYYVAEFLKDLGVFSKEDLDSDYPVKNFQRLRPQRNDNSARFDRIEEGLDETQNNVNQLADLFQKLNIFPPDSDGKENDGDGYDKVDNDWYYAPEKKKQNLANLKRIISYCLSSHHQYEKCACLEMLRRRNRKNQMSGCHLYNI